MSLETPLNWEKDTNNIPQSSHFSHMVVEIGMFFPFIEKLLISPQRSCSLLPNKYKVHIHFPVRVTKCQKAVRLYSSELNNS